MPLRFRDVLRWNIYWRLSNGLILVLVVIVGPMVLGVAIGLGLTVIRLVSALAHGIASW